MRYWIALLFICNASAWSSPTVKRLLILPAVNESLNGENAYVGPSLAEAIKTKLAERYFFFHPNDEAIENTRRNNFIQQEDLHTKSSAIQMGEWLRQDLVMNGRYSVTGNRLRLNLNLYEIETGRLLVNFKTEAPVTAKMFDTFASIATELGERMAKALPSQQELAASGGSYYDPEKGKRTLVLGFGTRAAGFTTTATNLSSSAAISNADFPHLSASLSYQRHSVLDMFNRHYRWPVFAQVTLSGAYAKRDYNRDGGTVPGRFLAFEAVPSVGYAFSVFWFKLEPYLGAGLGYANFKLDYSNLARKPVDTTIGQSITTQTVEQFYILSQAGMLIKYAIHPRWSVVLTPSATLFHYAGGVQAEINARVGAGFYF
ncbi:MAG: hypothetical protein U1F27_01145 [Turneriella sp.]